MTRTKSTDFKKNWQLPPRAHAIMWWVGIILAFLVVLPILGIIGLHFQGEAVPWEAWALSAFFLAVYAIVGFLWNQTLFSASDLKKLFKRHDGTLVSSSHGKICGYVDELKLVIRPWRDPDDPAPAGGGVPLRPLRSGRVEISRSGDFRNLPPLTMKLNGETQFGRMSKSTGNDELDRALGRAVRELAETNFDLEVAIEATRLRVFVTGASWMNRDFASRIEKTLHFSRSLLEELGHLRRNRQPVNAKSSWQLQPETHAAIFSSLLLMMAVVFAAGIVILEELLTDRGLGGDAWLRLAVFSLGLPTVVSLSFLWRRSLFQHPDLRKLLRNRGGDLDSVGYSEIHGHVGNLELSTEPWQDPEEKPLPWSAGGISPALRSARLEVSRAGDFRDLPSLEMEIYRDFRFIEPWQSTGHPKLDRALDDAVAEIASLDCTLDLKIEPDKLSVFVTGAAWTNHVFARRIDKTLDFTERLLEHLS